jgi:hypothetical protein
MDPEVLLRRLLVGYLYGITSERRLLDEIRMHLAYRWFTGLGFDRELPDHSTFSKNRHGRFRAAGVFRDVFEEIVRRGIAAGLVEGRHLTVDGALVQANASPRRRVAPEQFAEVARVSHTVREYLAELEQQNPVADPAARAPADLKAAVRTVSASDPDAAWEVKWGRAGFAYFDNYLIDNASRVIVGVEATPARFSQEALAARRMLAQVEQLGRVRRAWEPIKPTAAASSWRGAWRVAFSPTSRSLIAATRRGEVHGGAVSLCAGGEHLLLP